MSFAAYTLSAAGPGQRSEVSIRFTWKAWRAETGVLRWEIRRVLPTLGMEETQHTQLHKRVQKSLPGWRDLFAALALTECEHFGRSSHSLQQQARMHGQQGQEGAEKEYWCSTAGLMAVLLHGHLTRRSAADKVYSADILQKFIEHTVPSEALGDFFETQVTPAMLDTCKHTRVQGRCLCLHDFSVDAGHGRTTREACARLLKMSQRSDCSAIMRWCGALLLALAEVVDVHAEQWHGTDILQLSRLKSVRGNARRADPHVRAAVATSDRSRSGPLAQAAALDVMDSSHIAKVQHERLECLLHHMRSSCLPPESVISCWDCARIGSPARELLIHMVATRGFVMVLPPAVTGCKPLDSCPM